MHIGDGEKGVAHSFFKEWIFRNILILLDRYALFKVLDKPGVNYSKKLLNIHQQDFCESYFSLETIVYWLVTQSKVTYFPRFIYSPFAQQYTAFSYSAHFLSLVRHCKAHSLKKIRGRIIS